jgi:hypothetical protein
MISPPLHPYPPLIIPQVFHDHLESGPGELDPLWRIPWNGQDLLGERVEVPSELWSGDVR